MKPKPGRPGPQPKVGTLVEVHLLNSDRDLERRRAERAVEATPETIAEQILRAFAYAAAANGDPLPALAQEAEALRHQQ
jgi:hypothetical protein